MNNSKLNEILNENNIDARKVSRKEYNEIVKNGKLFKVKRLIIVISNIFHLK